MTVNPHSEMREPALPGLRADSVDILFQPTFTLSNGLLHAQSALLTHTGFDGANISGQAVYALVDTDDHIGVLGHYALVEAIARYIRWRGEVGPGLCIDLAPGSLADPACQSTIREALEEMQLPASLLTLNCPPFEVGMTLQEVNRLVQTLKLTGARLSLDVTRQAGDLLRNIHPFPFDEIKIPGRMIMRALKEGAGLRSLLEVFEMAKVSGARTVATGVENKDMLRAMKDIGFHAAAGELLAPARDIQAFAMTRINGVRELLGLAAYSRQELVGAVSAVKRKNKTPAPMLPPGGAGEGGAKDETRRAYQQKIKDQFYGVFGGYASSDAVTTSGLLNNGVGPSEPVFPMTRIRAEAPDSEPPAQGRPRHPSRPANPFGGRAERSSGGGSGRPSDWTSNEGGSAKRRKRRPLPAPGFEFGNAISHHQRMSRWPAASKPGDKSGFYVDKGKIISSVPYELLPSKYPVTLRSRADGLKIPVIGAAPLRLDLPGDRRVATGERNGAYPVNAPVFTSPAARAAILREAGSSRRFGAGRADKWQNSAVNLIGSVTKAQESPVNDDPLTPIPEADMLSEDEILDEFLKDTQELSPFDPVTRATDEECRAPDIGSDDVLTAISDEELAIVSQVARIHVTPGLRSQRRKPFLKRRYKITHFWPRSWTAPPPR